MIRRNVKAPPSNFFLWREFLSALLVSRDRTDLAFFHSNTGQRASRQPGTASKTSIAIYTCAQGGFRKKTPLYPWQMEHTHYQECDTRNHPPCNPWPGAAKP